MLTTQSSKLFMGLMVLLMLAISPIEAQVGTTWIAFVAERDDNQDIYLINPEGTTTYNLTDARSRDWHPSWSPDGTHIAFNSDRGGANDIYIMSANGQDVVNISENPADDVSPDWSPISDEIAFISTRDGGYDLYVLNVQTREVMRLTEDGKIKSDPTWSPDGTQIAFWSQPEEGTILLHVLNRETGASEVIRSDGQSLWPVWSPDGTQIAFYSQEGGTADIYLISRTGDDVVNITRSDANVALPAWSPDGTQIVFMGDQDSEFDLYIMDTRGNIISRLTDSNGNNLSPDWQPLPANIDFAGVALGLNAQVTGELNADAQEYLGDGTVDVYAPETVHVDDVFRVRVEIPYNVDTSDIEKPEEPLRSSEALAIHRFMGARLSGFDLENFDIMPDYNEYLLRIEEGNLNFWEWQLRAKNESVIGKNSLAVQIYLPPEEHNGTTTAKTLRTISFSVTVTLDEDAHDDELVVQNAVSTCNPVDGIRFEIHSSPTSFTMVFTQDAEIRGMNIAGAYDFNYLVVEDFPDATEAVKKITCLNYYVDGEEPDIPDLCPFSGTFVTPLNASDVFWFDGSQMLESVIRWHDEVLIFDTSKADNFVCRF